MKKKLKIFDFLIVSVWFQESCWQQTRSNGEVVKASDDGELTFLGIVVGG